jgi:hypothetical protein
MFLHRVRPSRHRPRDILLLIFVELWRTAALRLRTPAPPGLPGAQCLDLLRNLDLSFSCESFSAKQEVLYPGIEVILGLWKGLLDVYQEHQPDLEALFGQRGYFVDNGAFIRVMRRIETYMIGVLKRDGVGSMGSMEAPTAEEPVLRYRYGVRTGARIMGQVLRFG